MNNNPVIPKNIWQEIISNTQDLIVAETDLKRNLKKSQDDDHENQEKLLLDIINILDSFERVLVGIQPKLDTAERQARTWVNNFTTIKRQIERMLDNHGVKLIETPDRMIVPGLHNVIDTRVQLEFENDLILEEIQHGYYWKDKVLRQAQVIVVNNNL